MQRLTPNTKTHQIGVRVYLHELERLRTEADDCGVSFADYVRHRLGCSPASRAAMFPVRQTATKKAPAKRVRRPKT